MQYKFSNFYLYFAQFFHLFSPVARALYIHFTGRRQATAAIPPEWPGETDTSYWTKIKIKY